MTRAWPVAGGHNAGHDPLTGLANRGAAAGAPPRSAAAQPCWDVGGGSCAANPDGLKKNNDAHGHDAGDTVLRTTADRLRHLPASWDSSPFLRLLADSSQPVYLHGRPLVPSSSLGIAVADPHAPHLDVRTADTLPTAADQSMYRDG